MVAGRDDHMTGNGLVQGPILGLGHKLVQEQVPVFGHFLNSI